MQSLHSKLTFSHLAVTIITVFLLELLILGGMVLYLRSDAPAWWTGEQAAGLASELAWELEDAPLDRLRAEEFILTYFFLPVFEEEGEFFLEDETQLLELVQADEMAVLVEEGFSIDIESEWVIIFDTQNRVLASTDEARFTPGVTLTAEKLIGFDDDFLTTFSSWDQEVIFEEIKWPMRYAAVGNDHIGQSVILNTQGEVIGGVYFRAFDATEWFLLNKTLQVLALGLLGAAILAIIVSGVMGRQRLARELHDAIKQQLFGLSLTAGSIGPLMTRDANKANQGWCH